MYYKREEKSYEELSIIVKAIKPYKLIQKSQSYWERDIFEGYTVPMINDLVGEIEKNSRLSVDQKINLERQIARGVRNKYEGILHRGTLNVLLMSQHEVDGFGSGYKLTSIEGLKKNALGYTTYVEAKRVTTTEAMGNILGGRGETVKEETIRQWAFKLTELGKEEKSMLIWQAKDVVRKNKRILQKLGEI